LQCPANLPKFWQAVVLFKPDLHQLMSSPWADSNMGHK